MSTPIDHVINIQVSETGTPAAAENMNVCTVMTKQQDGGINTANRYELYNDALSVSTDFGSNSEMAQHANKFFGTKPNPIGSDGIFVAAYWRGDEETTVASAAVLTGAEITESSTVEALQAIDDGSFDIDVDGATENATSLDFRVVSDMDGVLVLLNAAITAATWTYVNNRIIVTSDTTSVTSLIDFAEDPGTGTFVGLLLGISSGSGASAVQGADSEVLSVETKVDAMTAIKSLLAIKGAMFIDAPNDADKALLATWAQANDVLMYDVYAGSVPLTVSVDNPAWVIKLSGQSNSRCLYSKSNNRKMATSYMARMHTVNFAGEKTAMTMQFKELSVAADDYSTGELTSAETIGLDVYATVGANSTDLLTSGANEFCDYVYNLEALKNQVQIGQYNVLKTTSTGIPQTIDGIQVQVDRAEEDCDKFIKNGVGAPGTWTSPDFFGDREVFMRSIEANGRYVKAASLADQEAAEREHRDSPLLMIAFKMAGNIHKTNILLFVNK